MRTAQGGRKRPLHTVNTVEGSNVQQISGDAIATSRKRKRRWDLVITVPAGILLYMLYIYATFSRQRGSLIIDQQEANRIQKIAFVQENPEKVEKHNKRKDETVSLDSSSRQAQKHVTVHLESSQGPYKDRIVSQITSIAYTQVTSCDDFALQFPIEAFPHTDPYLPWIHDYFRKNLTHVMVIAQNHRRCNTESAIERLFWEPQISLFQPISITLEPSDPPRYRFSSYADASCPETRFLCRFHTSDQTITTCSVYPFNYEFMSYRKKHTFEPGGKDTYFDYSTLLFSCPIPTELQRTSESLFLDIIPIRTPTRYQQYLFTKDHVSDLSEVQTFDPATELGTELQTLDRGRWENLPICPHQESELEKKKLVACTWTAPSYHRRGDATIIEDDGSRLQEWIAFHQMVGFDHIYIYDNTQTNNTIVKDVASRFEKVTRRPWPIAVCNNNRPNHPNPGERSSQYAAEASCRERYGPNAEWMSFMDIDEYFVPLQGETFHSLLDDLNARNISILQFRSSRGRPRLKLMEVPNESVQKALCPPDTKKKREDPMPCLVKIPNITHLRLYNCDYIKAPRPERFQRAMKQIYRPEFVLSHFVHYTTVTKTTARYYREKLNTFTRKIYREELQDAFADEIKEGIMMHAKAILPKETSSRNNTCYNGSERMCSVGIPCPASVPFDDKKHTKNPFKDENGEYCNCWPNERLEYHFLPELEDRLAKLQPIDS